MRNKLFYCLLIIFVAFLAWDKVLNFWFFKAYEATWLMGLAPHNLINLVRGHGFLYYLDLQIFGWNPWGWYLTALILHIITALLLFQLVFCLSKNIHLAGITGLLFIANTSYNDVLTWGSFNSYYPLLLIFILLTILFFDKFRRSREEKFLALSLILSFLAFFTRQTGLVVVPLVTLYDFIFYRPNLKNKKELFRFVKAQSFFYVSAVIFLLLNSWYRGTVGDTADSMVKMRIRLIKDGLFLEYARVALLTFGKLIPPHIIPYPILNWGREFLYHFIYAPLLDNYFFSFLGWIIFIIVSIILYSLRKVKKYFRILVFFWFWLTAFTLFTSLAVPNTQEVLVRAYEWNTMRYRYFAFVATATLFASLLFIFYGKLTRWVKKKKAKAILFSIISATVIVNLFFLWKIEDQTYAVSFKPGKEFYTQFKKEFPTLPESVVFYLYPHTPGLNDYLLEWYYLKDDQYPNLAGQPYRVESQIEAVLNKIKAKKINLEDVLFLDYNLKDGLINKTAKVRDLILHQKVQPLDFKKVKEEPLKFATSEFKGPPVELPYDLEIKMKASFSNVTVGSEPNSQLFRALVNYNTGRKEYLDSVKVSTSATMSQREGEPFLHVVPGNLIDGNPTPRSSWIADAIPAWLVIDLQKEKEIYGVAWGSQPSSTRIPATYSILVSDNSIDWDEVKRIKNNTKPSAIDAFDKPQKARFIKMVVYTTSMGDFALLDEFEVIEAKSKNILNFYSNRDDLIKDSLNMFNFVTGETDLNYAKKAGLNFYWGKTTWETNKTAAEESAQYLYFPYLVDAREHTLLLKLKEAEIYAGTGQFLEKYITSLSLDFGKVPFNVEIQSLKLVSRNKL